MKIPFTSTYVFFLAKNNIENKIEYWREQVRADVLNGSKHLMLASTLHASKQIIEAIDEYKKSVDLLTTTNVSVIDMKSKARSCYMLGCALTEIGEVTTACEYWTKSLECYENIPANNIDRSTMRQIMHVRNKLNSICP